MFGAFTEFHSSGTVRDLHPIPFSLFFHARGGEYQTCGKDNASFRETARNRGLFSPTAARKRRKGSHSGLRFQPHNIVHYLFILKADLQPQRGRKRKNRNAKALTNNALAFLKSTRSRDRTGTAITGHRILSPACLPIPPSGRSLSPKDAGKSTKIFTICQNLCNLSSPHRRRAGTSGFPDRGETR